MPRIALLPLLHMKRLLDTFVRTPWMRVNFRLKSLMLCQYGVCVSGSRKAWTASDKEKEDIRSSVCTPKGTRPLLPSIRILRRLNDEERREKRKADVAEKQKDAQTRPATRTALNVGSCKRKCVNRLLSACG